MHIHDAIKINLIHHGYLKNYPYHMISEKEMFSAFIYTEDASGYFYEYYPLIDSSLRSEYDKLIDSIEFHISRYLDNGVSIPDWVYSYMLGSVVSIRSDPYDIQYFSDMFNLSDDTNYGEFSIELAENCLRESKDWISKLSYSDRYELIDNTRVDLRPPTIFGEPHVEKSLRLKKIQL